MAGAKKIKDTGAACNKGGSRCGLNLLLKWQKALQAVNCKEKDGHIEKQVSFIFSFNFTNFLS